MPTSSSGPSDTDVRREDDVPPVLPAEPVATGGTSGPPLADRWAAVLAWLGLAVAALAVLGWVLAVPVLTTVRPGLASMKVTTALGLVLLAAVCLLPSSSRILTRFLVVVTLVVSAASLVDDLAARFLGATPVLAGRDLQSIPGRMSGSTALCLLLLALALLLLARPVAAQVLALAAGAIAFVGTLGYLYGVEDLYRVGPFSSMALNTSVALILVAAAVLLRVPDGVASWVLAGPDAGAMLVRVILPVLIIGLPVMGLVRLRAQQAGLFGAQFGLAVTITVTVLALTATLLLAGRGTRHLDRQREEALHDLERLNHELERRVQQGAERLERQHIQLALRNDRDRIARDLHDRVIQRLFAGGLQLSALQRSLSPAGLDDERRRDIDARVESVIGELNGVVDELRESIFALGVAGRTDGAAEAARAAVDHVARVLPFDPSVRVDDSVEGLPVHVVDQLVAVLREATSNIARHARATSARVEVEVREDHLCVLVEDDGVGLPAQPARSSGMLNLRARAVALGGQARWEAREPSGTRFVWRVPVDGPREG